MLTFLVPHLSYIVCKIGIDKNYISHRTSFRFVVISLCRECNFLRKKEVKPLTLLKELLSSNQEKGGLKSFRYLDQSIPSSIDKTSCSLLASLILFLSYDECFPKPFFDKTSIHQIRHQEWSYVSWNQQSVVIWGIFNPIIYKYGRLILIEYLNT